MSDSPVMAAALEKARFDNERWIARFVTIVALVVAGFESARLVVGPPGAPGGVEGVGGSPLVVAIALTYAGLYGFTWARAQHSSTVPVAVARVAMEVSLASIPVLASIGHDAEAALLDAPVLLYAMAVFVSALRLRPWLSLVAGGLAATEWIALYYVAAAEGPFEHAALAPGEAWTRVILLLATGVLTWQVSRSHLGLTAEATAAGIERERVRRAFGSYVAEPVVEQLLRGDLSMEPERRVITVLFVDIRNFTRFSEGRTPDEVVGKLNRALHAFAEEVGAHGGIVNKFLGDGLMALFGAPVERAEHARDAGQAAVAIARRAAAFSRSGEWPDLRIGIGLHCGEVVVGDVGGTEHREYTAIGDVVNVAARVEGLTKELGVPILATDAVREALGPGFRFGERMPAPIRGRVGEVHVTAVLVDGD